MKKEIKIGLLFLALFNLLNFTVNYVLEREIPLLHFFLGVFIGLALAYIIVGMLPESAYDKLKSHKKDIMQAVFNNKQ